MYYGLYPLLHCPAPPASPSAMLASSVAGTGARRRSLPSWAIQPVRTGRRRSIFFIFIISRTDSDVDLGAMRMGPNWRAHEALPTPGQAQRYVFADRRGVSAQHIVVLYNPGTEVRSSVVPRLRRRRRTERLDDEGEDLYDGRTVKPVLVVIENILIRHVHVVVDYSQVIGNAQEDEGLPYTDVAELNALSNFIVEELGNGNSSKRLCCECKVVTVVVDHISLEELKNLIEKQSVRNKILRVLSTSYKRWSSTCLMPRLEPAWKRCRQAILAKARRCCSMELSMR